MTAARICVQQWSSYFCDETNFGGYLSVRGVPKSNCMEMLVVVLFVVVLALAYYYFTSTFSYWKNKNVKFIKPLPLVGSMARAMALKEHILEFHKRLYTSNEGEPYVGYFQCRTPVLLVRDPELVKHILVKDFSHFTDHGMQFDEEADPLEAKNLFNMQGHNWKEMRSKLSPTFTSGRMKAMFPLVMECATQLEEFLGNLAKKGEEFEAKDILGRYTTDVIGSCAFGIKCDSLKDPNCEFRVMGKKLIEVDFVRALKVLVIIFMPEVALKLHLAFINKELTNFFRNMVHDVIALRKKTGEKRKDFMQLLIELKETGKLASEEGETTTDENTSTQLELTHDDLTAQATVFFIAGFETSSTLLSFALLELGLHPEVQRRAREEIENVIVQHGGELTYQAMQDMKYLDCIIEETLRMYPPVASHQRVCTKKYVIPNTDVTIDEGTLVSIPAHALQNDPQYFPDPEHFDPDRFNEERRSNFKNKFVYLPFGDGPRHCIGTRFAMMQSKLGLISVIRKYKILPSTRTTYPVNLDPQQFILTPREGVWIKLEPCGKNEE